jgi:hypothetical protein
MTNAGRIFFGYGLIAARHTAPATVVEDLEMLVVAPTLPVKKWRLNRLPVKVGCQTEIATAKP